MARSARDELAMRRRQNRRARAPVQTTRRKSKHGRRPRRRGERARRPRHAGRAPDDGGIRPPPDPARSRLELAEVTDPGAFVYPLRILVPACVTDASGTLRACDAAGGHHLILPDVEDALTSIAEHLRRLIQAL